jgi:diguanylate cyclase (GGDEF)-like protein/PAS domain S-box-containing protein
VTAPTTFEKEITTVPDQVPKTGSTRGRWRIVLALLVGAALGTGGVVLTVTWRVDQGAEQVRADVVGSERMLTLWLLSTTMQLASFEPGNDRDELATMLALARHNWQVAGEGGQELDLELQPTGRRLTAWPPLTSDHADVSAALTAYLDRIESVNDHNMATMADIGELHTLAESLVKQIGAVVRDIDDQARNDPRFAYAGVLFALAPAAFVLAAMAGVKRSRQQRTALEQGRAAAADAERRLSRLLDHAHDVLVIWTEAGEPRWISPSFQRIYGRPAPTTGAEVLALIHPDDRAMASHVLRQARERSGEPSTAEYRLLHGDGHWVPTQAIATAHLDDPLVAGVLITLRDLTAEHAADAELAEAAALHRFFDENSTELMIRARTDGRILYASSASGPMLELDPADLVGASITDLVDPADRDVFSQMLLDAENTGASTTADVRLATAAVDQSVWVSADVSYVFGPSGAMELHLSMSDIGERIEAEVRLADERRLLAATLASVRAGVLAIDREGRVIEANAAFAGIVGFSPTLGEPVEQVVSRYRFLTVDQTSLIDAERPLTRALLGEEATDVPCLLESADGILRHVIANAVPLDRDVDDDGRGGAVLTLTDVTALHQAQDELHKLAMNDTLTGLANRRRLLEFLAQAHRRNLRSPERLAVLFLDLDGFKAINDSLGHDAGDELLTQAGQRIVSTVRDGDFVARFGGDEFVVVAENLSAADDAAALAQRVEAALSEPFELRAGPVRIGGSVGIAQMMDSDSPHTLMVGADRAMYERKRIRTGVSAPG